MKRILLISDTHSHFESSLNKHIQACDEIWHAGDIGNAEIFDRLNNLKPLRAVHGNIDGQTIRQRCPEVLSFNCEGVRVLMLHIGAPPGKYSSSLKKLIGRETPQVLVCGHSHILKVVYDQEFKLLYLNPGSCGKEGFHQVKTALKFEIHGMEIKNLAVIEFGKRSGLP